MTKPIRILPPEQSSDDSPVLGFTSENDKVLLIKGQSRLAVFTEAEAAKLMSQLKMAIASARVKKNESS